MYKTFLTLTTAPSLIIGPILILRQRSACFKHFWTPPTFLISKRQHFFIPTLKTHPHTDICFNGEMYLFIFFWSIRIWPSPPTHLFADVIYGRSLCKKTVYRISYLWPPGCTRTGSGSASDVP